MKERSVLKSRLIFILYNIIVVVVLVGISEGLLAYLLQHPKNIPDSLLPAFRAYYKQHLRNVIQMDSSCAMYDPQLFYTLRPGKCHFRNIEFDTELSINSMGVRDNEQSLAGPKVVLLGDSYTMGWGIQQDATYANLLERALDQKVLNAGISSYGTVRELNILKRFDSQSLTTVVIQYNVSDLDENKTFVENGDSLVISGRDVYKTTSEQVVQKKRYFFGKHTALITKFVLKGWLGRLSKVRTTGVEDVTYFIHALKTLHVPDSLNIVVFETSDYGKADNVFIPELKRALEHAELPFGLKGFTVLDVEKQLNADDYFVLDNHLNKSGHKKISAILASALQGF